MLRVSLRLTFLVLFVASDEAQEGVVGDGTEGSNWVENTGAE